LRAAGRAAWDLLIRLYMAMRSNCALWVVLGTMAFSAPLNACAHATAPPPPAVAEVPQGRAFGAIAFSRMTHSQGASSGWATRDQAEGEATRLCGAVDCKVVTFVEHSCAALASSTDSSRWGWGADHRRERAEENALATCGGGGSDCRVLRWVCTD
jgi:hypothetical protein